MNLIRRNMRGMNMKDPDKFNYFQRSIKYVKDHNVTKVYID